VDPDKLVPEPSILGRIAPKKFPVQFGFRQTSCWCKIPSHADLDSVFVDVLQLRLGLGFTAESVSKISSTNFTVSLSPRIRVFSIGIVLLLRVLR
jgi:hypothetical protein